MRSGEITVSINITYGSQFGMKSKGSKGRVNRETSHVKIRSVSGIYFDECMYVPGKPHISTVYSI